MNRRGEATRNQIMDAAARLFAERGVDAVTMAEIHEATGQRNKSAIQYHFGSRQGLVMAIIERRKAQADELRAPLLASTADDDLPGLVRALVVPALANLDSRPGRDYLRIVSPVMDRFGPAERLAGVGGLLSRTLSLIGDCVGLVEPVRTLRLASALSFMTQTCATRARRLEDGDAEALDAGTFEAELVAMITGLVSTPVGAGADRRAVSVAGEAGALAF